MLAIVLGQSYSYNMHWRIPHRGNTMSRYQTPEFKELVQIQNTMQHIDILTITGFMNDEQFKRHLETYRQKAKQVTNK